MINNKKESKQLKNNSDKEGRKWKHIATYCLIGLVVLFAGYAFIDAYTLEGVKDLVVVKLTDKDFLFMLAVGFFAQLVDGALGMGYGVISTSLLLSGGLNPAVISGSIHTAEMFSSGASGFSHYRFGNVNMKLFKTLLIPGVLGAILGAILLGYLGEQYGSYLRPVIALYTFILGLRILSIAFKRKIESKKAKRVGLLAGAGGFLDSFGGGGWGPLVTSTLISKGKSPKYVIGSVNLTEFFVTMASALTFFVLLGVSHVETIFGLILGGVVAAPIAAKLAGKLPVKKVLIGVAVVVLISSFRTIYGALDKFVF